MRKVPVYNRCVGTSTANTLQHIMAMAAILCNMDLADLQYVHLRHGYCANPYWAQCVHRMACQRCEFYVPGDSAKVQALEADAHKLKFLEQIPGTDTERKALEGDRMALQKLIAQVP